MNLLHLYKAYFPKIRTQEEVDKHLSEFTRNLIERNLGKKYITEEQIQVMRKEISMYKF